MSAIGVESSRKSHKVKGVGSRQKCEGDRLVLMADLA